MKQIFKVTIFSILLFLINSCSAQNRALVIKHTGQTNEYIYPIIINYNLPITQVFSDEYLRNYKFSHISPEYMRTIKVDESECKEIENYFFNIVNASQDSTIFSSQYGSFDFIWFEDGKVTKRKSINDRVKSIELLDKIISELDHSFKSYDILFNELNYLANQFVPNQTKEVIKSNNE